MNAFKLIVTSLSMFWLLACSENTQVANDQPDINIPNVTNHMQYESSVPGEQAAAANEAISVTHLLALDPADFDTVSMAQIMKVPDVGASSLQSWLEARVSYIVSNGFDFDGNAYYERTPVIYPEAHVVPDAIREIEQKPDKMQTTTNDDSSTEVIMSNRGTFLYYQGKEKGQVVDINLSGIGTVRMTSPRAGILEIGPGLFPDLEGHKVQNVLLAIFRAGVLFHEARHSDGHGLTLGFFHAVCPPGSDYAGINACDASINGPYTVGSLMHKNLMHACGSSCTEKTKHALQMMYLDLSERTLSAEDLMDSSEGSKAGTNWDDTPEAIQ